MLGEVISSLVAMFPQISANAFHYCLIMMPLILYKVEASKGGKFFSLK